MKKIITTSAIVTVLLTSVQADFDFGDVFKDMKDAKITMSKNTKESTIKVSDAEFDFGDVFKDMKKAEFDFGDVFKDMKEAEFNFGDVFKDMKYAVQ